MGVAKIILRVVHELTGVALDWMDGKIDDPARRVEEVWPAVQSEIARAEWEDRQA